MARCASSGERASTPWDEAIAKIRKLPKGTLLRYGQAGDLPGQGNRIDEQMLFELVDVARRLEVIAQENSAAT